MSAHGVGVDLVSIRRIEEMLRKYGCRFETKLLQEKEIGKLPEEKKARVRRIAMSFAAKEALSKAMRLGFRKPVSFHQVAVLRDGLGAPFFAYEKALEAELHRQDIKAVHLSLSDEGGMACALALAEKN